MFDMIPFVWAFFFLSLLILAIITEYDEMIFPLILLNIFGIGLVVWNFNRLNNRLPAPQPIECIQSEESTDELVKLADKLGE